MTNTRRKQYRRHFLVGEDLPRGSELCLLLDGAIGWAAEGVCGKLCGAKLIRACAEGDAEDEALEGEATGAAPEGSTGIWADWLLVMGRGGRVSAFN